MINQSLIKYSLHNMKKRATRSFLTILSVLIGITAITSLISFGQGISSYVEDFSQQMGNDKIIIQPRGAGFGGPQLNSNVRLDESDLDAARDVHGVEEATGVYVLSAEIESEDQKKYSYLFGSDFKDHADLITEVYALDIVDGQELSGNEKNKAVLGYNYQLKNKIFDKPLKLRDKVLVNGHPFKIAGFYEEIGNPIDDANIYLTGTAVEELFGADNYQFILVRSASGTSAPDLAKVIEEELRGHRNQKKGHEDFFVQTFEQVIESFNAILSGITGAVILIALISVIVAAVNTMNTMYAAILERTKEIGVFKAIGSRNTDILFIFVFESGLLSLIGGIVGVILGFIISHYAGQLIAQAGYAIFKPIFTWQLVIGSLIFSFIIGIIAGFLPAYRASQLRPIDALRYE